MHKNNDFIFWYESKFKKLKKGNFIPLAILSPKFKTTQVIFSFLLKKKFSTEYSRYKNYDNEDYVRYVTIHLKYLI